MIIQVNGKPAKIKSGSSFEYISENRLFLGRDGYTLSIVFPLSECPENIEIFGHLNRVDVSKENVTFECSIIEGANNLFGTLSVVKISNVEVECQFSEGRCSQTVINPLDETLIGSLDLGAPSITTPSSITPAQAWRSIDSGASEVALPWINENYPTVPNNWVEYASGSYSWNSDNRLLSWQPYLIVIAKRICEAINYQYDFSEWEDSIYRHLIVCNTLPGSWYRPGYSYAMPGWTVSEFFEKLELFLMCEFDFNHKAQSVKMRFSKNLIAEAATIKIDSVVDSYTVDVTQEDDANCEYVAAKRVAYKECSHSMWNYYSCDWYVHGCRMIKRYATLSELIEKNKRKDNTRPGQTPRVFWGEQMGDGYDPRITTVSALLYAEDVDTYFAFRSIGTEYLGTTPLSDIYTQLYVLQPVNVFGSGSVEDDNTSSEDIDFVPVCIMDTFIKKDDDKGYMMFLTPSSSDDTSDYDDTDAGTRPGIGASYDQSAIHQPGPATSIEAGKKDSSAQYYDEINVAFWDGSIPEPGKTPYPIVDGVMVTQDWNIIKKSGFSMRLTGHSSIFATPLLSELPQVNPNQKFKFSWLSSEIPNARSIFFIKGKRYLCEKITVTFTEDGMSQLLKGEFYPLLDD